MKRIMFSLTLVGLLMGFRLLSGQTADCQKQCRDRLDTCKAGCMATPGTAGCDERCAKENAGCLSKCETVKPDEDAGDDADLDNDADYNDDSLDDDSEFED